MIRNCKICKKEFHVIPFRIKLGRGNFCSIKCRSRSRRVTRVKSNCKTCKKEFHARPKQIKLGRGKYCSIKCRITRVKSNCKTCKKEFHAFLHRIKMGRGKYCSIKCWGLGARTGFIDSDGYRRITVTGRRNIPEHRYVVEKKLGRKLTRQETVHHKNGNRADNKIRNLELWSKNHGAGTRVRDLRDYLKTIPKRLGGLK